MNAPSWDLFIGLFFIIGVSYGFMMQKEKVMLTLISAYAAIVVTNLVSPFFQKFFLGDTNVGNIFIKANASPFSVQAAIFVGIIVLITMRGGMITGKSRAIMSPFEMMIYSVLNSALILSTILYFLPEDQRNELLVESKFAKRGSIRQGGR
ncbi:MAG: Uncharacterized protein CEN89_764 [Candidatus Berkelbacteria bacterium Licking1014_7]|uniref:Colicin V production protein n=1 Tax=Candidatus Berkelbacteria bacterium Licking1014_7 TaxID=2017147 RepID=A0A554LHH7_9BACT|nr:MAG: Uncharacterized protein CEN89_764 [Candidatus Berkelbacteria bacterium Licking1014_7]